MIALSAQLKCSVYIDLQQHSPPLVRQAGVIENIPASSGQLSTPLISSLEGLNRCAESSSNRQGAVEDHAVTVTAGSSGHAILGSSP